MPVSDSTRGDAFAPVLRRLEREGARYFGAAPVMLEPVGHASGRFSEILRVRVRAGTGSSHVFVKIFKPDDDRPESLQRLHQRIHRDFLATARAHDGLSAHAGLAAVRPIACFPDELAIVTEQAVGETFVAVLQRRAGWRPAGPTLQELSHVLERLGAWLKAFQGIEPPRGRLSLDRLRAYLDVRLVQLVGVGRARFSEQSRAALLRFFDRRSREVADEDLAEVSIHADFNPENVLVNGTAITVLDFTMAKTGAVYHDLAHMFMYLELASAKPWFSRATVDRLQRALLRGFDATLAPERPLFELLLLQHVVCHLLHLEQAPSRPLARFYNWHVRRRQEKWIGALAGRSGEASAAR